MGLAHAAATLAVAGLPFAVSAGTAFIGGLARRRRPHRLSTTAGEWLEANADRVPGVRMGVSPELVHDADGYWPHVRTITLSRSTWCGVDVDAHAIAAHELGHAAEHRAAPTRSRRLALARRSHAPATQLFAAAALVGALYGDATLWSVAMAGAALAACSSVAIAAEEALATRHALRWITACEWSAEQRTRARRALTSAWVVYGAEALARVAVVAAWPWVGWVLMHSDPVAVSVDPAWLGWAVFFMLPVLVLHAGATVFGALRPPAPDSEFRLAWTAQREATWDFHAALVILLWGGLAAVHPASRPLAPLVLLAAIPAMGPLAQLTRGLALLPIAVVWAGGAHLGLWQTDPAPTRGRPAPAVPATDLAVPSQDVLSRMEQVLRVAYIPLAMAWIVIFIQ